MRLVPDIDYVEKVNWRDNQRRIVDDILANTNGQYVAATGLERAS